MSNSEVLNLEVKEATLIFEIRQERQKELIRSIWKIVRWQTAILLNSWTNGSKAIQPTDLLKLDDDTEINVIEEISEEALEIFNQMDELMANKLNKK